MRSVRRTWTTVAAGVLVAGVALAGCSSDDGDSGAGAQDAQVGEEADVELTEDNFFEEVAKAQLAAGTARVALEAGEGMGGGGPIEGAVVLAEDPADAAVQMGLDAGGSGGSIEFRFVDETLYMNLGEMSGGQFVEIDLADASNPLAEQYQSLTESFDPGRQLALLQENINGLEQAGEPEEIDGVEATPYRISVDAAAVLQGLAEDADVQEQELPPNLPEELTYTMFVGPDNLPRRLTTDLQGMETTISWSAWGEDVTIEAPPADEISEENPFETGA